MAHFWSFRNLFIAGFFMAILAACSQAQDSPTPQPTLTPTVTVTTPKITYTGPSIGSVGEVLGQSQTDASACEEGDACISDVDLAALNLSDEALPLLPQAIGDITLGIPTGYQLLEAGQEILITAQSTETLGGYVFSLRRVDETGLQTLLSRFDDPDFSAGTPFKQGAGQWLPTGDYGAIALLQGDDGQHLFIEAFAEHAYWPAFQNTFIAMLESLTP